MKGLNTKEIELRKMFITILKMESKLNTLKMRYKKDFLLLGANSYKVLCCDYPNCKSVASMTGELIDHSIPNRKVEILTCNEHIDDNWTEYLRTISFCK